MRREEHRWFSPRLHRDMPLLTFGHAGPVAIVFPTSMGVFHDFDDRGMVTAVADKIDAGTLRLACVSTVDRESFYATDIQPRARIERYLVYEQYLLHELVPFVASFAHDAPILATGCSFGGYHALTMALRHPDVFAGCITMGAAFDVTSFLDGYYDTDAYLLTAPHFLPGLTDRWFLDRIERNKWVFATGEHDMCRAENERLASIFAAKGIPHSLHVWGDGAGHDWPEWRRMASAYLP